MTFDKLKAMFSNKKPSTTIGDMIVARQRLASLRVDLVTKLAECDYCLDALDKIIARDTVVQELCSDSDDSDDSSGSSC